MSEALTFQLVEGHLKKVKIFEGQMKRPTFRIKFKRKKLWGISSRNYFWFPSIRKLALWR